MMVVGLLPQLAALLALAFIAGVVGLGVMGFLAIARRAGLIASRPHEPLLKRSESAPGTSPASGAQTPSNSQPATEPDDELRGTPLRLAQLERQLSDALRRADQQSGHLLDRRRRIEDKEDRGELLARYDEDVQLLARRAVNMRRVMALLWRTRAILELRAHIAISARRRPDLAHLPEGEVPKQRLDLAAEQYDQASEAVRSFVGYIDERASDLKLAIPRIPDGADVDEQDKAMVAAEQQRTAETYTALQRRMDRLADTLGYLADRCRTRAVVAGSEVQLEAGAGTEGLLSEVADALSGLQEMSRIGDQQLAESALDNLAEDISQLERAGLNARAAAEAELEIARLLEHVPG